MVQLLKKIRRLLAKPEKESMLSIQDISPAFAEKAYTQQYGNKAKIDGVKIIDIKAHVVEEGDFSELLRLNENGGLEIMPEFKLRQINRSRLFPQSIKGWHFHFNQDELWYISPSQHGIVALWDIRKGSPTEGNVMKIALGGGSSRMVYIPRGVAHGSVNYSPNMIDLYYFVNNTFNMEKPDEHRLAWDTNGKDFWLPERD